MRSLLIPIVFVCSLTAQVTIHGSLRGRVTDPSAAPVTGAAVQLSSKETNFAQATVTGADGYYSFPRVSPGRYLVSVERAGFRKAVRDEIPITVNEAAAADFQLLLGDVRESVTVEAASPLVHAQSVEISGFVNERLVKELPLNGRNFQKLVLLAPGVGGPGGSTPNNPAISGARPVNNTYANRWRRIERRTAGGRICGTLEWLGDGPWRQRAEHDLD